MAGEEHRTKRRMREQERGGEGIVVQYPLCGELVCVADGLAEFTGVGVAVADAEDPDDSDAARYQHTHPCTISARDSTEMQQRAYDVR